MTIVECAGRTLDTIKDTLDSIRSRSHRQQVFMGVGSGMVVGYIFTKIGRIIALLMGGSMIALQCAFQQDLVRVNWTKVKNSTKQIKPQNSVAVNKILKAIEENRVFFGSFGGGFLVASSFS